MAEAIYSTEPQLLRPRQFLSEAVADFRRAFRVASHLFVINLRSRYRRSLIGFLWLVVPSLGTAIVCGVIESRRIIDVAPTLLPYSIFVFSGMILWQTFVEALNAPLQQLRRRQQIITRTQVPHEGLVLAGLFQVLLDSLIRLCLLLVGAILIGVAPTGTMWLLPFGVASLALFGLSLGMLIAPLGLLYDDVGRAVPLATTFWFLLTPVVYPLPSNGFWALNPVAPVLATTRSWLSVPADPSRFFVVSGAAVVLLIVSALLYRLCRPHVIARLG